uniref:Uncharacterized protein n=1 Tax=Ditylenchus dipsaci TaxID=166011 RepID=A0A915E2B8_9BILA
MVGASKPQKSSNIINPTIPKSMSDVACNRRRAQTAEPFRNELLKPLKPMKGIEVEELEDSQATVGHGRGEWVRKLANEMVEKKGSIVEVSGEPDGLTVEQPRKLRPSLADVFNRGEEAQKRQQSVKTETAPEECSTRIMARADSSMDEGITFDIKNEAECEEAEEQPKSKHLLTVNEGENAGTASSSTIKDDECGSSTCK